MVSTADLRTCVFASGNPGKLRELERIVAPLGIKIVPQARLGISGAEETGKTFVENALLKAHHAARQSGLPAIADDSGLAVDALDGRPGVNSARYAGADASDADNIDRLLEALKDVADADRGAAFHCAMVLVSPDDRFAPLIAEAQWAGRILHERQGEQGFGYDPVFFDPQSGAAAACLSKAQKNARSHRGKAMRRLLAMLQA